jgi:hypothetical protein
MVSRKQKKQQESELDTSFYDLSHFNRHSKRPTTKDERTFLRQMTCILVYLSIVFLVVIILVGVYFTSLSGLPSISAILANLPTLAALVVAFIAIYIFSRCYLVLMYTNTTHLHSSPRVVEECETEEQHTCLKRLSVFFGIFLVLQITTIILVPVVKVTTHPVQHVAIACTGVAATIVMECLLLIHRWKIFSIFETYIQKLITDQKLKGKQAEAFETKHLMALFGFKRWRWICLFNAFWILVVIMLAIIFATYTNLNDRIELFLPVALAEYLLYVVIVFLPAFHMLDIRVTKKTENKVVSPPLHQF